MDPLHSWGVSLAVHFQTKYKSYDSWLQLASSVADLHMVFFFFFPIWFHFSRTVGIRLIWVAVIGDWLNLVLKWVLFGERPYWWVHDTKYYGVDVRPSLEQFPITCETGPGSPSGHAMGSAGVWYVMITAVLSMAAKRKTSFLLYSLLQATLLVLFVLVELIVCMSRVYIAAHFPHQVISGVISGLIVAGVLSRVQWIYSASMRKYFGITLFLTFFAVGFYLLLRALGVDLLWTLEKAQRWCVNPAWVHMDTTPFASLLRNMGTLFGLGLGLHSPLYTKTKKNGGATYRAGCIATSLLLCWLLDNFTFSSKNEELFYLLSFCKSAVAILIPTALVPAGLTRLLKNKEDEKKL